MLTKALRELAGRQDYSFFFQCPSSIRQFLFLSSLITRRRLPRVLRKHGSDSIWCALLLLQLYQRRPPTRIDLRFLRAMRGKNEARPRGLSIGNESMCFFSDDPLMQGLALFGNGGLLLSHTPPNFTPGSYEVLCHFLYIQQYYLVLNVCVKFFCPELFARRFQRRTATPSSTFTVKSGLSLWPC